MKQPLPEWESIILTIKNCDFRIIALQFDQSNPAVCPLRILSDTRSRFRPVILPPLIYCISVVQLSTIDHRWLPDIPPAPAEEPLSGGAVVGREVGGSELDQQCPGVKEVDAVVEQDKSGRLSSEHVVDMTL